MENAKAIKYGEQKIIIIMIMIIKGKRWSCVQAYFGGR